MNIICSLNHISKHFGGVKALQDVSLDIRQGEIHAVIGENGAGKSTLMNILDGVFTPSSGDYLIEGKPVLLHSPLEARSHGIAMVHQELSLAPALTVAENIHAGRLIHNRAGITNRPAMNRNARKLLDKLNVSAIRPTDLIRDINVSQRQLVEIAKAIAEEPKLLILDEPTAALTKGEITEVLKIMRGLRKDGVSILFITHKLEEVKEIADRITVLKDGQKVITLENTGDVSLQQLISYMVGRDFKLEERSIFIKDYETRKKALEVRHLIVKNYVNDVSFTLYEGEILGLTGLVGAGRSELLHGIYGSLPRVSAEILIDGKPVNIRRPEDAIRHGIGFVAEDRKTQGIYPNMSVDDNITSVHIKALANRLGIIHPSQSRSLGRQYCELLSIKTPSGKQLISNLSGGNQQKCIIARWLANNPRILFLDEPTHGIDIGTKSEIYKLIGSLAAQGYSIILLSSEMYEVLGLCDRIMVMHHGQLRGILDHSEASEIRIMSYTLEGSYAKNSQHTGNGD